MESNLGDISAGDIPLIALGVVIGLMALAAAYPFYLITKGKELADKLLHS